MKIGYADPPYVGQAKKHYGKEVSYAGEVDHAQLAIRLLDYDGWALSLSSPSLPKVISYFPSGTRVAAWVKPFAIFKPGANPAYAWEPVLFKPARSGKNRVGGRRDPTVRDWVSCNITLRRGLVGAKPEAFCLWLFDLLGMTIDDSLDDLFPGTNAVSIAWSKWKANKEVNANG